MLYHVCKWQWDHFFSIQIEDKTQWKLSVSHNSKDRSLVGELYYVADQIVLYFLIDRIIVICSILQVSTKCDL